LQLPGQTRLRRHNRARVLREIQRTESPSRTQIAEMLGLSLMAVTRIVRELIAAGLVQEGEKSHSNSPGRRRTVLNLPADGAYVLGVSLNAYDSSVSLANIRGEVVSRRSLAPNGLSDSKRAIAKCGALAQELIAAAEIDRKRVLGLGAVIAGVVDHRQGTVVAAPFLGWKFTDIGSLLRQAVDMPVIVENLDNALLSAEVRFGMAVGRSSVLYVRSAAGLGGSLFLDGQLIRGARFRAGQIGHLPVKGARRTCSCGQTGCLNTVSSGGAVLVELGRTTGAIPFPGDDRQNKAQLDEVLAAAMAGEARTNRVLFSAGRHLGQAVLQIAAALDPEEILLAGPLGCTVSYQGGFKAGLAAYGSETADFVRVSTMDDAQAAVFLALSELVFSDRLSLRTLRLARRQRRGEHERRDAQLARS
jgi:predicted NBD/HSP70 family sugar kinase